MLRAGDARCMTGAQRLKQAQLRPVVLNTKNRLHKLGTSLNYSAVSNQTRKRKLFEVDRPARAARRTKPRTVQQTHTLEVSNAARTTRTQRFETTLDHAEARQLLATAAESFIATVEFYKSEPGDRRSHDEAVKATLECYEARRADVQGLAVEEINWGHMAAVAEANTDDALDLWARVRENGNDELESGKRGAKVAGHNADPLCTCAVSRDPRRVRRPVETARRN